MPGIHYHVVVVQQAEEDLAALWVAADSPMRERITQAWNRTEQALRLDPDLIGKQGPDGSQYRCWEDDCLRVYYRVVPEDRHVYVVHVSKL